MPATSDPAPGSVTPTAVMVFPAITPGRYFSSWRLVPKRIRCGLAMSVWTSTVMAKPPWVERPTSSASTTDARASSPAPPSASGTRSEKKPSAPISRSTSRGTKPASSHFGPSGFTFSSTKRRSWARMRSCSSVKMGCAMARGCYTSAMSRDKRLQDRSIYPHWCSDTVRFSDQDGAGHVNNVAICAYMETARLTFMRDMGMMAPREEGLRGISAGMTVSFLAESHWPGKVELGTGVLKIGTSSITVASAAFRDDLCIAAAEMTVVRLKGKTPHPIDPAFREALEKYRLKGG